MFLKQSWHKQYAGKKNEISLKSLEKQNEFAIHLKTSICVNKNNNNNELGRKVY